MTGEGSAFPKTLRVKGYHDPRWKSNVDSVRQQIRMLHDRSKTIESAYICNATFVVVSDAS